MKYKVGDTVKVKSLEWYNENKNHRGVVYEPSQLAFIPNMQDVCGCELKITDIHTIAGYSVYLASKDNIETPHYFADYMLE